MDLDLTTRVAALIAVLGTSVVLGRRPRPGRDGHTLGTDDRGGYRAGRAVGRTCALRTGERADQPATDSGGRRRPAAAERANSASELGPDHRRSRDAARSGTGRPVRGADDLTRPST